MTEEKGKIELEIDRLSKSIDPRRREDGRNIVGIRISHRTIKKIWGWIKKRRGRKDG